MDGARPRPDNYRMETTTPTQERLSRHRQDRWLGGVAGGIGHHFAIDPLIVRVSFVVLCFFGGAGFLLYGAAWLLIPEEGATRSAATHLLEGGVDVTGSRHPGRGRLVLGIILALVAFDVLFNRWSWSGRHWGEGLIWVVLAMIALAAIALGAGRGQSLGQSLGRRLALASGGIVAMAVLVFVLVVGALASTAAISGVPLGGGIGDRHWQPTSPADLHSAYRLGAGNLVVDLRQVNLPVGDTTVDASVGVGHLTVEVPPGTSVSVDAHSGVGQVVVFGNADGGVGAVRTTQLANPSLPGANSGFGAPHLILKAQAGVGDVEVTQ